MSSSPPQGGIPFTVPQESSEEWWEWIEGKAPVPKGGEEWNAWMAARRYSPAWKAAKAAAGEAASPPTGSAAGEDPERDEGLDELLAVLDTIARDKKQPASARVAAVRHAVELRSGTGTGLPTTVAQVQALSTDELHALIARLEVAHPWPGEPEAASAQG